jgi:thiamine biosynthesis lipoprotein
MRTVAVEQIMGTAIGIDARDAVTAEDIRDIFDLLREADRRYSPFLEDSIVSRLASGRLRRGEVDEETATVLALCARIHDESDGAFDIGGEGSRLPFDPSGLVKGWAVQRAADLATARGWRNFTINAGGDIVVRGEAEPGRPWRIGIRHPEIADAMAAVVALRDTAIATSATYERGEHIIDPATGTAPRGLLSMSVAGPDLTFADAYATAAYVKGADGLRWVAGRTGYEALAITAERHTVWTAGFDALLVRDAARAG